MTKNNYWIQRLKNRKVSVTKVFICLVLVILLVSFALVQGYAYELPVNYEYSGEVIVLSTYLTDSYLDLIYSVVNNQAYCGSFNSYDVVGVYYASNFEIRMTLASPSQNVYYTLEAGYFERSYTGYCSRMRLTTRGFEAYTPGSTPTVAEENMIMYRNAAGELVVNDNHITGAASPNEILTVYSLWFTARNDVVGGNTQDAYNEGYQDGYDDGRSEGFADGRETGYAEGYSVGYDAGLSAGGGGDVVITEEIDVGSLITALPQAARNIIDGAFGFTIFGINIAATLIAILVVAIVAFIVRWLLKR